MKHSFSTWSKRLASEVRTRFKERLRYLDRALSETREGTPRALRETELRGMAFPEAKHETALAALECAAVCRESHPDDFNALCAVMKVVIKGQLPLTGAELQRLLEFLAESGTIDPKIVPVDAVLGQIERMVAGQPAPAEWWPFLEIIHQTVDSSAPKKTKSIDALLARIKRLSDDSVSARLKADDGWADLMQQDLGRMSDSDRKRWETLLGNASAVAPEPPAKDWEIGRDEVQVDFTDMDAYFREHDSLFFARNASAAWKETISERVAAIGVERFESMRLKWLQAVLDSKPGTLSQFSVNRELLRGLLWTCERSGDPELARGVRIAAEYLFRKNSPLGRTSVRILAHMDAGNCLEELTYLVNQVKSQSQVRLIESARVLVADRTGVPSGDLSDLPLPESGFNEIGRRVELLSGFSAEITVTRSGTVELRWFKPTGQQQKSVPAKVKREHASDVRNLKATVKEVKSTLAAVRERIESAPLEQRTWTIDDWRERYLDHPVAGTIGRRVLWEFECDGDVIVGAIDGESIVDVRGRSLKLTAATRVSVWHPIGSSVEDVLRRREWLAHKDVTQPFKQAHREVYILTEAERSTEMYSNRFAAHILKQSQFRALAKTRGWKTDYLGPWNGGDDGIAARELPHWELSAEFWTNAAGDEYSDAGGFFYIATDQVRFCRPGSSDPLPLSEVPQIVFSEIMRDVDLFVGVSSVGNDPTWRDGGPDGRHADYWESYSFGELSETAVTRRAALEEIIPRLKIADRCTFSDRFLIVRGDIRTYRIHLGSSNILMEPNDEYLCIVPAQGARPDDSLFLPFEGDNRLSVILSKALLLADDTSITDATITSQIR